MATETNTTSASESRAADRLAEVGAAVCDSLEAIVESLGGVNARPTDVASEFGVHVSVASRLLKALRTPDRVAAVGLLPGTEALRAMVSGSGGGVGSGSGGAEEIKRARRAVEDLDQLIRVELGGRDGMAAILSDAVPEHREGFELRHRQAAHRAMANLMGVSADVDAVTVILAPCPDDDARLDALTLSSMRGLRQRRPGCVLSSVHQFFTPDTELPSPVTIDGAEPEDPAGFILWDHTTVPREQMSMTRCGDSYVLRFDVGPIAGQGYELTMAIRQPRAHFAQPRVPGRSSGIGLTVAAPARHGVVEILAPEGVWEGRQARALTHLLGARGGVDPNDAARCADEIRVIERVERIGPGQLRLAEMRDHPGLIASGARAMGVDPGALRGFRVRSSYPIVGTQISLEVLPPGDERAAAVS